MVPIGLTDIPTIDQLLANPARAADLSPKVAQSLLIGLVSLQPILLQRALVSATNDFAEEELLTMPVVAHRLKVSTYRAYELARQGVLKSVRLGKSVRVRTADLSAYVAQQRS